MTEKLPPIFSAMTEDARAPETMRAVAWMAGDKPGRHWTCTGASEDEAREKLAAFWLRVEAERPKPRKAAKPATDDITSDDDEIVI